MKYEVWTQKYEIRTQKFEVWTLKSEDTSRFFQWKVRNVLFLSVPSTTGQWNSKYTGSSILALYYSYSITHEKPNFQTTKIYKARPKFRNKDNRKGFSDWIKILSRNIYPPLTFSKCGKKIHTPTTRDKTQLKRGLSPL